MTISDTNFDDLINTNKITIEDDGVIIDCSFKNYVLSFGTLDNSLSIEECYALINGESEELELSSIQLKEIDRFYNEVMKNEFEDLEKDLERIIDLYTYYGVDRKDFY